MSVFKKKVLRLPQNGSRLIFCCFSLTPLTCWIEKRHPVRKAAQRYGLDSVRQRVALEAGIHNSNTRKPQIGDCIAD